MIYKQTLWQHFGFEKYSGKLEHLSIADEDKFDAFGCCCDRQSLCGQRFLGHCETDTEKSPRGQQSRASGNDKQKSKNMSKC